MKVTNSDLALHAGPVGRGMKNWDADDVMRELGLPILEYQEEPDYDSDQFAIRVVLAKQRLQRASSILVQGSVIVGTCSVCIRLRENRRRSPCLQPRT